MHQAELKYARRCMYAFLGFLGLVIAVVVLDVVLSRVL
jgi:hypothetical protein